MPDRRLLAIVTGLMLIMGSLGARAAPTLDQLRAIDTLLSRNDTTGLRAFIEQNPGLLAGKDELAKELRRFYDEATRGRLKNDYLEPSVNTDSSVVGRSSGDLQGIY